MARHDGQDVLLKDRRRLSQAEFTSLLGADDEPDVLLAQLSRLNTFDNAGDPVVFGASVKELAS